MTEIVSLPILAVWKNTLKGCNHMYYYLASERSERDTYRGNTIENRGCLFIYLFVYMFGRTYVILYFDPRVFVLIM